MHCRKYKVPGQRSLNRIFRRFLVSNFTDEHDVRVMTQNTPKSVSKRQSDLGVYLNLIDTFKLVLNRIFRRNDLDVGLVNLQQRTGAGLQQLPSKKRLQVYLVSSI